MQLSRSGVTVGVGTRDGSKVVTGVVASVRLLVGVLVGVGVIVARGVVVAGTGTGILFLTGGVRRGEVRGGRVGVGVAPGIVEGATDGLIAAGGLIVCGGSAPGEWGCSAMTTPVTAAPLTASVATVRA